jgi:competence protein ComEC
MNRLKWQWDENPMLPVLVWLAAGIWPAGTFGTSVFWGILPVSAILLVLYLLRNRHIKMRAVFRTLFAGMLCWIAGAGLTVFHSKPETLPKHSAFYGIVTEAGDLKENGSRRCLARIVRIRTLDGRWADVHGNAVLWLKGQAGPEFRSGHGILASIPLRGIPAPAIPGEFNARKWYQSQGVIWQAFIGQHYRCTPMENKRFSIRSLADTCRLHLEQIFLHSMPENDDAAMLSALLLGIRRKMHPELKEAYSAAGLTHILAVSGMHVALIFGFFSFIFSSLKKLRGGSILFAVSITAALWFYALITGLSPSVLRAVCLFSIMQFSDVLRKPSLPLNNLCFASILLILAEPGIISDLGYQLSFAAVYGIISFQKSFSFPELKFRWRILNAMKENMAVTMAASLATLPIILFHFHRFPVYFLISNLLAVPFSNLLIYAGLALIALSPIPQAASASGWLLHYGFISLNTFVQFINEIPFSSLQNIYPSFIGFTLLILFVLLFQIWLSNRKLNYLNLCLTAILSLCLLQIPETLFSKYSKDGWYPVLFHNELFIFQKLGNTGRILKIDPSAAEPEFLKNGFALDVLYRNICPCKTLVPASSEKKASRLCLLEGRRILWLNHYLKLSEPAKPLSIDYLFLGRAGEKSLLKALKFFRPELILCNLPADRIKQLRKKYPAVNLRYWQPGERVRKIGQRAGKEPLVASPEPENASSH